MLNITSVGLALETLNMLHEDFTMLNDGSWVPDADSIEASLEIVEGLMEYMHSLPEELK
jgi:hypothetical protein